MAGGDEAYNHWDTLEDMLEDPKKVDQVWDAFKKSFEQSTSFWHFRDAYLTDFRQDPTESTADLDLHIKQTVRGCQWKKDTEEERIIDLLYHATIYYEIRKYIQESEPAALKYKMVIEKAKAHEHNIPEYKDHQASHGETCIYWEQQWPWQGRWQASLEEEDAKEATKAESTQGYIQELGLIRSNNYI